MTIGPGSTSSTVASIPKSTGSSENPKEKNYSKTMNYETYDNNRSTRIRNLINSFDTIDYNTFKQIKYDNKLPKPLNYLLVCSIKLHN